MLVHYDDLPADLEGRCAGSRSGSASTVPDGRWPALVEAATFARMRDRADVLTPNPLGVLKDNRAFFRRGSSGADARC